MSLYGSAPLENRLLAALPPEIYDRLVAHAERVTLSPQQILHRMGEVIAHVYFQQGALVSLLKILEDGSTIEVGLIGSDSVVGISALWGGNSPHQALVQIPGHALRLKTEVLRAEFERSKALQSLLLQHLQSLLVQVSQLSACHHFHHVEARLARQLLLIQDALQVHEFALTQEALAQMLGIRRASVSIAARQLSQLGWIRYGRGHIQIIDRKGLESVSCECYSIIRSEFSRSQSLM